MTSQWHHRVPTPMFLHKRNEIQTEENKRKKNIQKWRGLEEATPEDPRYVLDTKQHNTTFKKRRETRRQVIPERNIEISGRPKSPKKKTPDIDGIRLSVATLRTGGRPVTRNHKQMLWGDSTPPNIDGNDNIMDPQTGVWWMRPIRLLPTIKKKFGKVLALRPTRRINERQFGFQKESETTEAIKKAIDWIKIAKKQSTLIALGLKLRLPGRLQIHQEQKNTVARNECRDGDVYP